ncbi:subtilisin-like serine protease PR1H [Metarhizium guizhouense ARSEF 977]|uniref:Subtilisin-like serine protease PR1H n=1 Tax=Metarhizium guizhouense (strain ARSEF 977) TaxID=1276136 RepID=A0A0B4GV52_METGA|nr:subtilisin-like serine protease PR1H [Metarhizium guizhouense ARSEF 977]
MKCFHWTVVLAALLQTAATEQTSSSDGARPLGHIVVLKEGLESRHLDSHLEWVKSVHKRSPDNDGENHHGVKPTYDGEDYGFLGYAGHFPPSVLEKIKRHQHVDFVEQDQAFTLELPREETPESQVLSQDDTKSSRIIGRGGLTMGQGYNTFLDKGAIHNAVLFSEGMKKRDENSTTELVNQDMMLRFNFTPPSADLTDIDMSYFDRPDPRALIEQALAGLAKDGKNTTALTKRHTRTAGQDECNGSFHEGGKMIARVTFTAKNQIAKNDLQAQAKASLRFWGVSGDIDASAKKSMEDVDTNADVEIKLFYQGELGRFMLQSGSPERIGEGTAQASFLQAKSWADQFIQNACQHRYAYRPLLDEYRNVEGFPDDQDVPDYSVAHRMSYMILSQIVVISDMKDYLLSRTDLDSKLKYSIQVDEIKMVQLGRNWVQSTVEKPEDAIATAGDLLETFDKDFRAKYEMLMPQKPYIAGVKVVYGGYPKTDPPAGRVKEVEGRSDDINHGRGGDFVWLVPIRTEHAEDACTSFELVIDQVPDEFGNLAKGSKDKSRYLRCKKSSSRDKIRRLALYRRRNTPPPRPTKDSSAFIKSLVGRSSVDSIQGSRGYTGRTQNINQGRPGADELYLFWSPRE